MNISKCFKNIGNKILIKFIDFFTCFKLIFNWFIAYHLSNRQFCIEKIGELQRISTYIFLKTTQIIKLDLFIQFKEILTLKKFKLLAFQRLIEYKFLRNCIVSCFGQNQRRQDIFRARTFYTNPDMLDFSMNNDTIKYILIKIRKKIVAI